jgi:hypothetical protein
MSKTFLRHTLITKYFWLFCWLPYLYTFSLYENASFIIVSAETEYISTRSWYSTTMYNIRTNKHIWANNTTPFIILGLWTSDIVKLGRDHIEGIMVFNNTLNNISVISCRSISVYHHWSCDFESCSGEVYSMQYYIVQFGSFFRALRFPPQIKLSATI